MTTRQLHEIFTIAANTLSDEDFNTCQKIFKLALKNRASDKQMSELERILKKAGA